MKINDVNRIFCEDLTSDLCVEDIASEDKVTFDSVECVKNSQPYESVIDCVSHVVTVTTSQQSLPNTVLFVVPDSNGKTSLIHRYVKIDEMPQELRNVIQQYNVLTRGGSAVSEFMNDSNVNIDWNYFNKAVKQLYEVTSKVTSTVINKDVNKNV